MKCGACGVFAPFWSASCGRTFARAACVQVMLFDNVPKVVVQVAATLHRQVQWQAAAIRPSSGGAEQRGSAPAPAAEVRAPPKARVAPAAPTETRSRSQLQAARSSPTPLPHSRPPVPPPSESKELPESGEEDETEGEWEEQQWQRSKN